jgi:hypothetical protein
MASTYSDLKIELIGTGEQTGTWGSTTNNNFSIALGEAITGSANVAFSSADVTVTLTDTNAAQTARNLRLNLTGTSGGARNLILGSGCQIEKLYLINNGLADAVTVKNTLGTGIAVPAGKSMFVFNNGTDVVDATTYLSSLTLGTPLPITSGGTGSTSTTYVNLATNVTGTLPVTNGGTGQTSASAAFNALSPITTTGDLILGNGTNSATRLGIGSNGFVLTSNGTTATWAASTGGVTSFNAGTTGFTPNTSTTGAITLAGTLIPANGGTGLTSPGTNGNVLTSNGTAWVSSPAPFSTSTYTRTSFTATGGQTTFTVSYTAGFLQVYLNGVFLNGTDFTATNGSTVVLATGATAGDIVETIAYSISSIGTASIATNIAGGAASQIPYQAGLDTTAFIPNGTAGQILTSNGTSAPSFQSPPAGGAQAFVTMFNGGNTPPTQNSDGFGLI